MEFMFRRILSPFTFPTNLSRSIVEPTTLKKCATQEVTCFLVFFILFFSFLFCFCFCLLFSAYVLFCFSFVGLSMVEIHIEDKVVLKFGGIGLNCQYFSRTEGITSARMGNYEPS